MRVYTNPDVSDEENRRAHEFSNMREQTVRYVSSDGYPSVEEFMREEEEARERAKEERKGSIIRVCTVAVAASLAFGGLFKLEDMRMRRYYDENGNPKRIVQNDYINGYGEPFSRCYDYAIVDGEPIRMYKSSHIYYLINSETNEISEYAFFNGADYGNKHIGLELFDLDTEELLVFEKQHPDVFDDRYESQVYYNYLLNNFSWIPLTKASNYIDGGMEIKEAYTREEIAEIKDQVLAGYKKIKGVSSLSKKR